MGEERVLDGPPREGEVRQEERLRPARFSEYIGQKRIVENIRIMADSANLRKRPMDHCLFSGPPGLGKTSLAMIVTEELGSELHVLSGPAVEKKGDLAAVLTGLQPRDVLFIDEIHRMHVSVEEILYSAMEDFRLDILIGQGPSARTMRIDLPPFTLVGATTRSGLLSKPLRTRFTASFHFDFYGPEELAAMVRAGAAKLGVTIDGEAVECIARRSRGTPRLCLRILRRVRDFALVEGDRHLSRGRVEKSLSLMEIDRHGLDRMDRKILRVIRDYYSNGPVGIDALCATLAEDRMTVEDVFEPFLLKEGLLIRTPRGREITRKGVACLEEGP